MTDYHDDDERKDPRPPRPAGEGVRIIGAEEAARALEEGQAEGRRPDDAPRFGDVPRPPEGPRPGYRFPLPESVDPASAVPRPAVVTPAEAYSADSSAAADEYGDEYGEEEELDGAVGTWNPDEYDDEGWEDVEDEAGAGAGYGRVERLDDGRLDVGPPTQQVEMPHWTEPPSGQVPRVLAGEEGEDDDLGAWAGLAANQGPRWRDSQTDWEEGDFDDDLLADDEVRLGALDVNRTEHSDLFSFDEPEAEPEPEAEAESYEEPEPEPEPRRPVTPIRTRPAPEHTPPGGGRRDMGPAVGVGLALGLAAILAFRAGPVPAMILVLVIITLAAVEVFDVLRRAGYRPATLLALTATVSIMLASYNKGEAAVPLVLVLTVLFAFLWYLFEVVRARPTVNLGATFLGFLWVGFLGSFAALLLHLPHRHGVVALFGAALCTVAYDVGGLFFGSQMGRRPWMARISPNKTVEGLLGGCGSAVVVGLVFGMLSKLWSTGNGIELGLVVAVVAPLGDLAESMIKRDVGIKDMGSILPGHGGVLDRFDALLFGAVVGYFVTVALVY
jgi:phosphatidate cytidylyltransferase